MAHGSKKWIVAYDGRVKKSNNRTKLDWLRDLQWWDCNSWQSQPVNVRQKYKKCPQCTYVRKQAQDNRAAHDTAHTIIRAEFNKKYNTDSWMVSQVTNGKWTAIYFFDFLRSHKLYQPLWHNDSRSFLCFKCEQKRDTKNMMWSRPFPGNKKDQAQFNRRTYRQYRAKMNHLVRNERYDDLIPRKRAWFD